MNNVLEVVIDLVNEEFHHLVIPMQDNYISKELMQAAFAFGPAFDQKE